MIWDALDKTQVLTFEGAEIERVVQVGAAGFMLGMYGGGIGVSSWLGDWVFETGWRRWARGAVGWMLLGAWIAFRQTIPTG